VIVHAKSRHLLLNLRNPARVAGVIPHLRSLRLRDGRCLHAVPHRTDEVRLLRNLGIDAPAPAVHYYGWPGRFAPYAHQRVTVGFLSLNPRAYVTSGLGSGKTLCGLWAYDWLRREGIVHKLLVVSPLSTLEPAWGSEIFRNLPELNYAVLHGAQDKRLKLLDRTDYDIYIINHDGLTNPAVLNALCKRADIDICIIDELACYRNRQTDRWKALNQFINGKQIKGVPDPAYPYRKWAWGFTGTPIPNAPTDAYGQCRLLTPQSVPRTFGVFRDQVMNRLTQFKWVAKPNALSVVHQAMQPAIRFAREDCIDLPPTTHIVRDVALTPEQTAAYQAMKRHLRALTTTGELTAANDAVALGRLLQICAGASYAADGSPVPLPCQPRIDEALEVIEEADAKVIIFVPYTAALEHLAQSVATRYTVEVVHGATSRAERDRIFSAFQFGDAPRVLIANPAATSHGLTLTAADTILWFAPVHSNEIWEQANARIVRPGQTRNTRIVCLRGSDAEQRVYERLQAKGKVQGLLLDMLRDESNTQANVLAC